MYKKKLDIMQQIPMIQAFNFLVKLELNNNREWFIQNKNEFLEHDKFIKKIFSDIYIGLNKYDDLESFKVHRIYRDIRFSKDKTPFKNNFSAGFVRRKPFLRGGLYFHLQANNESFIGAGFFAPNKEDLLRIRKAFENNPQEIIQIVNDSTFKKHFNSMLGEELKSAPKGFDKNHIAIEFIKKKQFLFMKKYKDEEVFAENFKTKIINDFQFLRPFLDYMTNILT